MKHFTFEHSQFSPCSWASIPIYIAHGSPGDTIYWAQPNWLTQTTFLNTSIRSQPCKHGALGEITVPRIHKQHWPVQCPAAPPASIAPWTLACTPVPRLHFPLCQWSAHNPDHVLSLPSPPFPGRDKYDHSCRYPSDLLTATFLACGWDVAQFWCPETTAMNLFCQAVHTMSVTSSFPPIPLNYSVNLFFTSV